MSKPSHLCQSHPLTQHCPKPSAFALGLAIATSALGCGVGVEPRRDGLADDPTVAERATSDLAAAALARGTGGQAANPQAAGALAASPEAAGCVVANAGDGFVTLPVAEMTALGVFDFTVTASAPHIDAVIGLASGEPTWFPDIAVGVRLADTGTIDVRDGGAYRADVTRSYGTTARTFHVIADVTSHRYSVIQGSFTSADELAKQYAFRSEQQAVTKLDHVGVVVDGAVGAGSVSVCAIKATPSIGVAYSREGTFAVAPLGADVAVSDGASVQLLDATGQLVAQAAGGGALAGDDAENLSVARVAGALGSTLIVDQYGPGLAWRGQANIEVGAGATVQAIARTEADVIVALAQGGSTKLVQVGTAATRVVQGGRVVLDGDEAIVVWSEPDAIRVARFSATGAKVWSRSFVGRADLTALTVDPAHRVVFGGELLTATDFGGGVLPLTSNPDHATNGFVVELSACGDYVFATRTGGSWVGGIAANGQRVVVSGTLWTQFPLYALQAYDATGAAIAVSYELGFAGDHYGRGGSVAIDGGNRVWWNVSHQWPLTPQWPFMFAIEL